MLSGISLLNILAVLAGIMLAFGGPIVIASLVKLYRRNLGRFLEASGCSLNFPLRLSGKLGSFFTQVPKRPADSRITFGISGKDPIPGHKISLWLIVLFLVIALTYCILCFTKVLPFPPWKKKEVPCSQVCNKADDNKKLIKTAAAPAGKSVKKTQSKASPGGN